MARPLRIVFPGALYHVTSRGNNRARVFRIEDDYEEFLGVTEKVVGRYGWLCHAYCVLGNHYHLVIETPQPNLTQGMRQLNGVFAQRYNRRRGRIGHVFQARYHATLVEQESHLLSAIRYVARNPVRARLCKRPEDWKWSSHPAYLGMQPAARFLTRDWVLSQFGKDRAKAQRALKAFVDLDAPLELVAGVYAARPAFLAERIGVSGPIEEVPRRHWQPVPPSLEEIFQTRTAPVAAAYREFGYSLREIAAHLGRHYSTVSRRLLREEASA